MALSICISCPWRVLTTILEVDMSGHERANSSPTGPTANAWPSRIDSDTNDGKIEYASPFAEPQPSLTHMTPQALADSGQCYGYDNRQPCLGSTSASACMEFSPSRGQGPMSIFSERFRPVSMPSGRRLVHSYKDGKPGS